MQDPCGSRHPKGRHQRPGTRHQELLDFQRGSAVGPNPEPLSHRARQLVVALPASSQAFPCCELSGMHMLSLPARSNGLRCWRPLSRWDATGPKWMSIAASFLACFHHVACPNPPLHFRLQWSGPAKLFAHVPIHRHCSSDSEATVAHTQLSPGVVGWLAPPAT